MRLCAGTMGHSQSRQLGRLPANPPPRHRRRELVQCLSRCGYGPGLLPTERIMIAGPHGEREVPIDTFFQGPGRTCSPPTRWSQKSSCHRHKGSFGWGFSRRTRTAIDIALVSSCAVMRADNGVCNAVGIGLGAVAPLHYGRGRRSVATGAEPQHRTDRRSEQSGGRCLSADLRCTLFSRVPERHGRGAHPPVLAVRRPYAASTLTAVHSLAKGERSEATYHADSKRHRPMKSPSNRVSRCCKSYVKYCISPARKKAVVRENVGPVRFFSMARPLTLAWFLGWRRTAETS